MRANRAFDQDIYRGADKLVVRSVSENNATLSFPRIRGMRAVNFAPLGRYDGLGLGDFSVNVEAKSTTARLEPVQPLDDRMSSQPVINFPAGASWFWEALAQTCFDLFAPFRRKLVPASCHDKQQIRLFPPTSQPPVGNLQKDLTCRFWIEKTGKPSAPNAQAPEDWVVLLRPS